MGRIIDWLTTWRHGRAAVAVASAVVFLGGVLGVVAHDGDDTQVQADRSRTTMPLDLTTDDTVAPGGDDTTSTSSLLPPPATPSTTATTAAPTTTTTTAPALTCTGAASTADKTGLWLVDVADGRLRRVVDQETDRYAWSPDGRYLAYLDGPQTQRRLAVLDLSAGTARTLFDDHPVGNQLAWTPDSRAVVFAAAHSPQDHRLHRVPAAGGDPTQVLDLDSVPGDVAVRPDGSVVFTDGGTLAVADADGGNRRVLVQSDSTRSVHAFEVSPDGARVAYTDRQQLAIVTIAKGAVARAGAGETPSRALAWAKDGSRVAFVAVQGGVERAVVARPDGGDAIEVGVRGNDFALNPSGRQVGWVADRGTTPKLTVTDVATRADRVVGTNMWQPTWSADGDAMAFVADVAGHPRPAVCQAKDGTGKRLAQLAANAAPYAALAWSPSGATLAFGVLA
ncbi:MAG: hypothetical protein KY443_06025 [Actinobacteria bacterium]|nr:hypothetical protein [Actinomycetota bacterium]